MRVRKLSLSGIERTKLFLGYVGENEHTQIRFDASCIYTDNPGAWAGLTMQNPAGTVFPIVLDADGNEIIWNVSASDVAIAGNGSYQLTFTDNDEIIKTFIGQLFVLKSLTSAGDIPTPIDNWIDQANQKLAEVEAATESIDNMDASATKLSPDASPTVTVSDVDGHKHLAFGIPQGEKGDKGEKGDTYEVTPENIEEISSRVVQSATIEQYTEGMADQVEAAQQHAKDAGDSATAADSSKKSAAQSAQAASQSASAADTSARNAAQSATNAGNSAQAAAQSAQAASQSASNAAQSERNAADSAQDAQDVLDSIPADYSTLSTDVANLKSAVSELESLDNAPAIIETVSGNIASFDDGAEDRPMKSLVAHIEPVQDLHGYDNPWPAGGGKNLLPYSLSSDPITSNGIIFTLNSDGSITINGTATANAVCYYKTNIALPAGDYVVRKIGSNDASNTYAARIYTENGSIGYTQNRDLVFTLSEATNISYAIYVYAGFVANNIVLRPMIEAGSTASEWTPYSNICPISGWTGVKVSSTGKNLFDKTTAVTGERFNQDGIVRRNNTARSDYILVKPNTTYYFKNVFGTAIMTPIFWYDKDKVYISGVNVGAVDPSSGYATSPANATYVGVNFAPDYLDSVAMNYPDTATDYEPYQGQTYDITFPSEAGTVYGGTLDIVSGKMLIDRSIVDLGSLNWSYAPNSNFNMRSTSSIENALIPENATSPVYAICTSYQVLSYQNVSVTDKSVTIVFRGTISGRVWVHDSAYNDATAFKNAMDGVHLVYKLANPVLVNLTPQEVKTLLGHNNIWADTGDADVTYQADTKTYIDKKFTELQAMILENIGG